MWHPLLSINSKLVVCFFLLVPWSLNFICRCFGTLCLFHLHRWVGMKKSSYFTAYEDGIECVLKQWHIKFRHHGITQKKAHNIQNTAKVWNQEFVTRWWFYTEYFWHTVKSFVTLGLNHYIRLQWKNEALNIMPVEGSVPVGLKDVFRIWGAQKNIQVQGVPRKFLKCTPTALLPPISILIPAFLLLLLRSICVFFCFFFFQFWPSFHCFPLLLFTLYTYWNSINTQ